MQLSLRPRELNIAMLGCASLTGAVSKPACTLVLHTPLAARTPRLSTPRNLRSADKRCSVRVMAAAVRRPSPDELKQTKLITAIKTPYEPNGRIDLPAFDRFVRHQVQFFIHS